MNESCSFLSFHCWHPKYFFINLALKEVHEILFLIVRIKFCYIQFVFFIITYNLCFLKKKSRYAKKKRKKNGKEIEKYITKEDQHNIDCQMTNKKQEQLRHFIFCYIYRCFVKIYLWLLNLLYTFILVAPFLFFSLQMYKYMIIFSNACVNTRYFVYHVHVLYSRAKTPIHIITLMSLLQRSDTFVTFYVSQVVLYEHIVFLEFLSACKQSTHCYLMKK